MAKHPLIFEMNISHENIPVDKRRVRLVNAARKRLRNVLIECRDQMRHLEKAADTYSLLTGLSRAGQKWSILCHFLCRWGECFSSCRAGILPDQDVLSLLYSMISFSDDLSKAETLEDMAELASDEGTRLTEKMVQWLHRTKIPLGINCTRLRQTMRFWTSFRNTWRPSDHCWEWNSWPREYEYLLACPSHPRGNAHDMDLMGMPVEDLARVAAGRLYSAYVHMVGMFSSSALCEHICHRMYSQIQFDICAAQVHYVLKQGARNDLDTIRLATVTTNGKTIRADGGPSEGTDRVVA